MRADAARNRLLLLSTAKAVFAQKGAEANLDEIARAAGVGIGTLYRHFPTRDALVEAVYRNEAQLLIDAAIRLAGENPPVEALRSWMLLFVDHMATKRMMAEALNALVGGASNLYAASGAQVKEAIGMLVDRAVASGDIVPVKAPFDLLRALAGVAYVGADPDWQDGANRLVDILIAGLRITGSARD
ncbi:MAG TPA: helix-turn-helix domain-containing protein [Sphingobium sp.]